jgi:hypothetical protein
MLSMFRRYNPRPSSEYSLKIITAVTSEISATSFTRSLRHNSTSGMTFTLNDLESLKSVTITLSIAEQITVCSNSKKNSKGQMIRWLNDVF